MKVINLVLKFIGLDTNKNPEFKNTTNSIVIEFPELANLSIGSFEKWKELIS
jgi:hypothetical protein